MGLGGWGGMVGVCGVGMGLGWREEGGGRGPMFLLSDFFGPTICSLILFSPTCLAEIEFLCQKLCFVKKTHFSHSSSTDKFLPR